MSYGIIESYGGAIGYRGNEWGGATFFFELPVTEPAARPITPARRHSRDPMTDRLYYTDPYLRAFDATVDRVEERDGRVVVTLDRTAFYPTSGGQPFDTGLLGGSRVLDVVDEDDGTIAHVVEHDRNAANQRQAKRSTARSTGRGASITCSSTPASTCCRRRSIGCSASAR